MLLRFLHLSRVFFRIPRPLRDYFSYVKKSKDISLSFSFTIVSGLSRKVVSVMAKDRIFFFFLIPTLKRGLLLTMQNEHSPRLETCSMHLYIFLMHIKNNCVKNLTCPVLYTGVKWRKRRKICSNAYTYLYRDEFIFLPGTERRFSNYF